MVIKPALPFEHFHSAHCESGVMALLLSHYGLQLSEAMVFGLSGAMMFAYIPFVKLGGMPMIAYRRMPKAIIKGIQKNLGVKMEMKTFSRPNLGTAALDNLLTQGQIVGLQSSVFWLPYFPEDMRFHFNAHNLIAYGKKGDEYLISDPVFESSVRCSTRDLERARFVKGMMAPKGLLYYPVAVPEDIEFATVIPRVVRKTARAMLKTPVPVAGIRAIYALAKTIGRLQNKDLRYVRLFLGHIVRMQEEIGTGGAGFRFIYASFLQEAGMLLDDKNLHECSRMMTAVGDKWREFALMIAKSIRKKNSREIDLLALEKKLESVADAEADVYRKLLDNRL